jgi:hypothetical protein
MGQNSFRSENLFCRVKGNLRFLLTFTYHGCPFNAPGDWLYVACLSPVRSPLLVA